MEFSIKGPDQATPPPLMEKNKTKQAGAELGQAQAKFELLMKFKMTL